MNYQVIARRYRPRRFEEVVGQESIAETLRAGILQRRVAHAYLFAGPRGVGKTSMARIFAKALNCPRAADRSLPEEEWARPCDACSACEAIHLGHDIDVAELDGASHRGIEDVRSIVESVNRPATRSPFKIFIIDEVHMLTREAFNALLKTLEEPPGHVKFIFATTEAHRIPETVLSRCQRFDFHPIDAAAVIRRLSQILAAEGREAEEGLLPAIARYGKGGLRDAQTLLDQLMTFSAGKLAPADLERITGRMPEEAVAELAAAAAAGDPGAVLEKLRRCFARGADPALLLEGVIDSLRGRLHALAGGAPAAAPAPAAPPAAGASPPALDRLLGALQILLAAARDLRHSPFPEVAVEVVLLKVARLEEPAALEEVIRTLARIERGTAPPPAAAPPAGFPAPAARARPEPPAVRLEPPPPPPPPAAAPGSSTGREPPPPASPAPSPAGGATAGGGASFSGSEEGTAGEPSTIGGSSTEGRRPEPADLDPGRLVALWEQIRVELGGRHPDIAPFFKDVVPEPGGGGTAVLRFPDEFFARQMKMPRKQSAFEDLVREVTGAPWRFRMEHGAARGPGARRGPGGGAGAAGPAGDPGPGGPAATPRRGPGEGIASHALVKKSIDLFKGRLV